MMMVEGSPPMELAAVLLVGLSMGLLVYKSSPNMLKREAYLRLTNTALFLTVYALIFLVGITTGNLLSTQKSSVIYSIILSIVFMVISVSASFAAAIMLVRVIHKNAGYAKAKPRIITRSSLVKQLAPPTISLLAGAVVGYIGTTVPGHYTYKLLLILILLAGFSLGLDIPSQREKLLVAGFTGILMSTTTMVASAISVIVLGSRLGLDLQALAVIGLASGWYTLAGPMLMKIGYNYALMGFLANLLREALHLVVYPLLARRGLAVEAVSIGGATTMDTGLPVVVVHGGTYASAVALAHGMMITLLAPIISSFILSL